MNASILRLAALLVSSAATVAACSKGDQASQANADSTTSTATTPATPMKGNDKPLPPGRSIRFGTRPDEKMELTIPAELPFLRTAPRSQAAGQETLKLIATTRQTDFRALCQGGFRGVGAMHALDRLLGMTAGGPTRDTSVATGVDEDDWTTVERSFWLQPAAPGKVL